MANPLNPEAGAVPYPEDELGLELTHVTARVMWRSMPFLAARYGERGWRFTLSDAGWLVAIAPQRAEAYCEQVMWLTSLLAPRGMPSWVMEAQLRHLRRLGRRRAWPHVEVVAAAEDHLASLRRARLSDEALRACAETFAREAGCEGATLALGLGLQVASAFLDVELGHCRSASSFVDWLRALDEPAGSLGAGVDACEAELARRITAPAAGAPRVTRER